MTTVSFIEKTHGVELFPKEPLQNPIPIDSLELLESIRCLFDLGKLEGDFRPGMAFLTDPQTGRESWIGSCSRKAKKDPWQVLAARKALRDLEETGFADPMVRTIVRYALTRISSKAVRRHEEYAISILKLEELGLDNDPECETVVETMKNFLQYAMQWSIEQGLRAWEEVFGQSHPVIYKKICNAVEEWQHNFFRVE